MEKKSILIVMPMLPYPLISGGHQALYNAMIAIHEDMNVSLSFVVDDEYQYLDAVEEFTEKLPDVTLFPFYQCERIADGAKRKKEVRPWYSSAFHSIFHKKRMPISKETYFDKIEYWKLCSLPPSAEWIKHNQDIIDNNNFDFVQIEMPWLINTILGLSFRGKIIYVHHELGFARRALEMLDTPKNDYLSWSWLHFADMNEICLLNKYDAIITLSPNDMSKLKEAGVVKPVYSSMAIVDSSSEPIVNNSPTKRLTFMGPDVHAPNFDGITWFLENCWSQLKAADPEYTLDIIGKWSEYNIQNIKSKYPGVNFLGYVDDLSETLKGSIMIVPINIGSGIRMKILEASSRGIPFVSTSVGAEGIPVKDGVHCFIADTPELFVQDILKLKDVSLQAQFVNNSNEMVKKNYSLEALRENRLKIYNSIYNS